MSKFIELCERIEADLGIEIVDIYQDGGSPPRV